MLGRLSLDRFHAGPHCSGPNDVLTARYRSAATRGLIVFCVAFPLMGAPSAMADQIAGETHAASTQHPDQEIGLLLLKVEQQIAAGHALAPESDSAMDAWLVVIMKAHPASPDTLKALAAFAAHMRDRAEAETAAGRLLVSIDFSLFAKLANDLLTEGTPTSSPQGPQANASRSAGTVQASSGSAAQTTDSATSGAAPPVAGGLAQQARPDGRGEPAPAASWRPAAPPISPPADATGTNATRPPTPAAQPTLAVALPQPAAGPAAPGNSPPADATGTNATHPPTPAAQPTLAVALPQPTAGPAAPGNSPPANATGTNATRPPTPAAQPTLAAAASAAHLVTGAPATQEQSVAALYASRGDQMLAIKDVSAARRFYQYAANAGSAGAATALARTFDPSFLSQSGVIGLRPDPAQAAVWYRKAAELGDRNAETRLQGVSAEVAK